MMSKFSKEIIDAARTALEKAGLVSKIKEHIKMSNQVKLAEAMTVDGKTLSFEGEKLAVGTNVSVKEDDVLTPAEGKFEVVNLDGTKVNVTAVAGVVTEVMDVPTEQKKDEIKPDAPKPEDPMAALVAMETKMSAQKDSFETKLKEIEVKFSAQSKLIETLQADNKVLLEMADALVKTPVKDKDAIVITKAYEEMTNHEKMLFNKGKL